MARTAGCPLASPKGVIMSSDVRLFQDINAIESLRNSDFDALSAYGEVIDNSIQANAKTIKINFHTKIEGNRSYEFIKEIEFGDDGDGMDPETLHRCLQLGWSSRYNDRSRIGRFGVGMTLAAIHECKRVKVYSKVSGGDWFSTYIDLDEIKEGATSSIPMPSKVALPEQYKKLVSDNSGTIVVWSKYDRQTANASRIRDEAKIWIGRTYRYFIWDGVNIFLNGEEIKVIDPLYVRTEKTRFPDDPPSTLFDDIVIKWPVDEFDAPPESPSTSNIVIRMSLLNEKFRPYGGVGGTAEVKARNIHENNGISILRNRREVFYGEIPYWGSVRKGKGWSRFDDIDRWWGCEILFDAVLDRAFSVKNIKRGAEPNAELKESIKHEITPTRESCLEKVRELWKISDQEARVKETGNRNSILNRPVDHDSAEEIAKVTPTDMTAIDEGKSLSLEVDAFIQQKVKNYNAEQKAALDALIKSQPFTIIEDTWTGSQFVENSFLGGKAVLRYNMGHIFFDKVYGLIRNLDKEDADPVKTSKDLKALLDLLIIAFAKGAARFPKDAEYSAEEFIENLSANWGQYLQSYVKTWAKENE